MADAVETRLLETGGGLALIELSPFGQQVLTWLLLWSICLGVIHVTLSWVSGRLPLAAFCLLGALASTAVGLYVLWETLREHADRSLSAALLWGPGFAIGLFVVGAVGSAAWAGLTQGLIRLLGRRREEPES